VLVTKSGKVAVAKGEQNVRSCQSGERGENITVVAAHNATGTHSHRKHQKENSCLKNGRNRQESTKSTKMWGIKEVRKTESRGPTT